VAAHNVIYERLTEAAVKLNGIHSRNPNEEQVLLEVKTTLSQCLSAMACSEIAGIEIPPMPASVRLNGRSTSLGRMFQKFAPFRFRSNHVN
jgi:hypothetical protein